MLSRRAEVSATLGCLPALKPYTNWLPKPFFRDGLRAVKNVAGIAVARVNARLKDEEEDKGLERKGLLGRLMEGRDENGEGMGREELMAEALMKLILGSEPTRNTLCAGLYRILRITDVMEKIKVGLRDAIPDGTTIPEFDVVNDLLPAHPGMFHA